jgi:hypothetical protein
MKTPRSLSASAAAAFTLLAAAWFAIWLLTLLGGSAVILATRTLQALFGK